MTLPVRNVQARHLGVGGGRRGKKKRKDAISKEDCFLFWVM